MLSPSGWKRGQKDPPLMDLCVCLFVVLFIHPIRNLGPSSTKVVV
jgi:hypothetical protein